MSLAGSPFAAHPAPAPQPAATPASAAACFRKRRRRDPLESIICLRDRVHREARFVRLPAQDDRFGSNAAPSCCPLLRRRSHGPMGQRTKCANNGPR